MPPTSEGQTSVASYFESLCKEAELHGAKVLAERVADPSPGHIVIRIQLPHEVIEGTYAIDKPTSPEQQAMAFMAAKARGIWRWPPVEDEV